MFQNKTVPFIFISKIHQKYCFYSKLTTKDEALVNFVHSLRQNISDFVSNCWKNLLDKVG